MDLLLGLDVGTTATKALLCDLHGRVIASASYTYGLLTPQPKWVEQDPEELWHGVVETIRAVLQQVGKGHRVLALAQASQAGTTIPVDAAGQPLQHAISWMDARGAAEAAHVAQVWGAERLREMTGWALWAGLPLQHIAWLRQNRQALFAATRRFLFVNDFITFRLTGRYCMNASDAGITQLMNVATRDWDERLLALAGVQRAHLSPICPSGVVVGTVTPEAAAAAGLSPEVLVVNGAHDQYCAAIGAGVTAPGDVLLSSGTAWVIVAVPESLEVALRSGMSVSPHPIEGQWGVLRSLGGVGASLEWFIDQLYGGKEAGDQRVRLYDDVNAGAARSAPGAGGLLFVPFGGHLATLGTGRGGFVGLSLAHTRDCMARAIMEGIGFELRWYLDELRAAGLKVAELKMVGGAARSPVWPQIVADITGLPVVLPAVKEAAACGAAILAGVGAGVFADVAAGSAAFHGDAAHLQPETTRRAVYDAQLPRYQALVRFLGEQMPSGYDEGEER